MYLLVKDPGIWTRFRKYKETFHPPLVRMQIHLMTESRKRRYTANLNFIIYFTAMNYNYFGTAIGLDTESNK